jgi:hypothetical protein
LSSASPLVIFFKSINLIKHCSTLLPFETMFYILYFISLRRH